jgi:hypothetical protein
MFFFIVFFLSDHGAVLIIDGRSLRWDDGRPLR